MNAEMNRIYMMLLHLIGTTGAKRRSTHTHTHTHTHTRTLLTSLRQFEKVIFFGTWNVRPIMAFLVDAC